MKIDFAYVTTEDRMRLSLQGQSDWYMTRSLLLKLVSAWIDKLNEVDLPSVGIPLGLRDIGQEHALSLEFDAPTSTHQLQSPAVDAKLLQEVTLTVDALGAKLVLRGQGLQTKISLTRKESHMLLEMFAQKAKAVGWTDAITWPKWLAVY